MNNVAVFIKYSECSAVYLMLTCDIRLGYVKVCYRTGKTAVEEMPLTAGVLDEAVRNYPAGRCCSYICNRVFLGDKEYTCCILKSDICSRSEVPDNASCSVEIVQIVLAALCIGIYE